MTDEFDDHQPTASEERERERKQRVLEMVKAARKQLDERKRPAK